MIRPSLRTIASMAAFATLIAVVTGATATAAPGASTPSPPPTHLGAVWDAPNTTVRLYDPHAVQATVARTVQQSTTDNSVCDLYIATYTLTFTAINGHHLTAQNIQGDDFSNGFQALDTTVFTMTPAGGTIFEQAPTQQLWFLKGTHQSSPDCPPDLRSTNHVEIYVSGKGPKITHSIVRPPSKSHLAAVWTWPTGVQIINPPRITVNLNVYQEAGKLGGCQSTEDEIDIRFSSQADPIRIIAVGIHSPGSPTQYQNGNTDSFDLGTVGQQWFRIGTHKKSGKCPADTLSQDRIEIYTSAETTDDH